MVSDKLVDKALHKQKSDKSVSARFAAYGLLRVRLKTGMGNSFVEEKNNCSAENYGGL